MVTGQRMAEGRYLKFQKQKDCSVTIIIIIIIVRKLKRRQYMYVYQTLFSTRPTGFHRWAKLLN